MQKLGIGLVVLAIWVGALASAPPAPSIGGSEQAEIHFLAPQQLESTLAWAATHDLELLELVHTYIASDDVTVTAGYDVTTSVDPAVNYQPTMQSMFDDISADVAADPDISEADKQLVETIRGDLGEETNLSPG